MANTFAVMPFVTRASVRRLGGEPRSRPTRASRRGGRANWWRRSWPSGGSTHRWRVLGAGLATAPKRVIPIGPFGRRPGEDSARCVWCIAALHCAARHGVLGKAGEARSRTTSSLERPLQHFHLGNLDKIQDAPPRTWATVHRSDFVTFSELMRRGFYLVDMTGELWTVRRAG